MWINVINLYLRKIALDLDPAALMHSMGVVGVFDHS